MWERIDVLASTVGVTVVKPRTARMQCHRTNAGDADQSCSDYYRVNVYFPFIDHVIRELETRFSSDHDGLVAFQHLIPYYLPQDKVDSLHEYYVKFLTYEEKENFATELLKWKNHLKRFLYQISLKLLLWHWLCAVLKPSPLCTRYSQYS